MCNWFKRIFKRKKKDLAEAEEVKESEAVVPADENVKIEIEDEAEIASE